MFGVLAVLLPSRVTLVMCTICAQGILSMCGAQVNIFCRNPIHINHLSVPKEACLPLSDTSALFNERNGIVVSGEWLTCQTALLESGMRLIRLWDMTIHVNIKASCNIWWVKKGCSRECPKERSRDWVWHVNQAVLRTPYSDNTTGTNLCQRGAFLFWRGHPWVWDFMNPGVAWAKVAVLLIYVWDQYCSEQQLEDDGMNTSLNIILSHALEKPPCRQLSTALDTVMCL